MTEHYTMVSTPLGVAGNYPSHLAKFGQGGFEVVADIAARDAIIDERKKDKMVFVKSNDAGDPMFYFWDGAAWQEFDPSGNTFDLTVSMTPDTQYGSSMVEKIRTETPLMVMDNPDEDKSVKMYIKHDAFEPMHKPSFLAYLKDSEEVIGKNHHGGTLWFDDIVKGAGAYIQTNRTNKTYGIEEADALDPNVSGGTDYLVSFRAHMRGKAPNDGYVRAYLYNTSINPYAEEGILTDVNGHLMAVERHYKAGEVLGTLDVTGVVNAKGLKEFSCHIVDNFTDDRVNLTDRTEGCTGLMIQAITSEEKTGEGLVQYQLDTGEVINFSSHYLGEKRASIDWLVSSEMPMEAGKAGQGQMMADGMFFFNSRPARIGVQDSHFVIEDNGIDICDFQFGKIFSAEETQMLRGKTVVFSGSLTDQDAGFNVKMYKWTGLPDADTSNLNGWDEVDTLFISENAVAADHDVSKSFVVPADANNYAIVIEPVQAQQPITLKLKKFDVNVKEPFIGYAIKAPKIAGEQHLAYSDQYKELVQDSQGYYSLRYTVDKADTPLPVGELRKGLADIALDTSVNMVTGSSAKGGEGAIRFLTDGEATISTQLNVWNEQKTPSTFNVWYSTVDKDGNLTKIDGSNLSGTIPANTKGALYMMPTFKQVVEAGDRIALTASANIDDGIFLECVSDKTPLVKTTINFKETVAVP